MSQGNFVNSLKPWRIQWHDVFGNRPTFSEIFAHKTLYILSTERALRLLDELATLEIVAILLNKLPPKWRIQWYDK